MRQIAKMLVKVLGINILVSKGEILGKLDTCQTLLENVGLKLNEFYIIFLRLSIY